MNFFFFLDSLNKDLSSSVEVFNRPASERLCKDVIKTKNIIAFYSDGKKWISKRLDTLQPFESKLILKKDLPREMLDESVFICLSDKTDINKDSLMDEKYMNSSPSWRANTKIYSNFCSSSYQGEYPYTMAAKKVSLVSCSPMLQKGKNINSYFYLINLKKKPEKNFFKVNVMNSNKDILKILKFKTNHINFYDMNEILKEHDYLMYIFNSEEEGGIPIYFSNKENKYFSLEHTHPPTEYTFEGNRHYFQKKKKSFWSS